MNAAITPIRMGGAEDKVASRDRRTAALAAVVATAAAYAVFSAVDPERVHYHLSAVPAFVAFVVALGLDVRRARARATWLGRGLLLLACGLLAIVALQAGLPLSVHALLLGAALAYEVVAPSEAGSPVTVACIVPGLLVCAWYKVVVWDDATWLGASLGAGVLAGAALALRARR